MQSLVRGCTDVPLAESTIGQALDDAVDQWSSDSALVVAHQNIDWTWSELGQRVDSLAIALIRLGFQPGDRIGIWATNQWEMDRHSICHRQSRAGIGQYQSRLPAFRTRIRPEQSPMPRTDYRRLLQIIRLHRDGAGIDP